MATLPHDFVLITMENEQIASGSYVSLIASPTTVEEDDGVSVAFTLTSSGVTNGTTVGFTISDSTLDPQPNATVGGSITSNSNSGDSWRYQSGQYGWVVDDTNSQTFVVWNGVNVGNLPTTGANAGSNAGTYQSITEAVVGSFIYEQGEFVTTNTGQFGGGTSGEIHHVRRRSTTGNGLRFDEWEFSYNNSTWTTGSAGGFGTNTQGLESAYHGQFTMSSDTDAVYVRALDESEAEGTQTMIIRLHDEDSVSVSTGNLLDDVSITDPPGNQFEINTTSIQALSVGTAAEAIVTAKVRSDGDFQATAFSSSTPAAAVVSPLPNANSWVTAALQGSGFGDSYQIQVLTRTNPFGVFGSGTLSAGPAVNCTHSTTNNTGGTTGSWNNQSNNWTRLDSQFTVLMDAAAPPNGAFSVIRGVDIEIKQYGGVLGTGTTVLQHRIVMEADADDS